MSEDLRVSVTDLVGRPGKSRSLVRAVTPDDDEQSWGPAEGALDGPIDLDLTLDAVVDGVLVRGTVDFPIEVGCARCLEPQRERHAIPVSELFVDPRRRDEHEDDEPGYEIAADLTTIDLTAMLHDVVVMAVPLRVLCREDCQGLCPVCGTDRNDTDCGHDQTDVPDPRWAKLEELDLPPG